VAGLILPARAASGISVAGIAPHAVMAGAMAFGMLGGHSAARMLAAAAALVVTSLACARRARSEPMFREHLADLWAMALVLVALAPGHVVGHSHGILPHGLVGLALIGAGWALVRALLARGRWLRALPTALVFVVGFALMAMFCS
jgi:hypothetical protein